MTLNEIITIFNAKRNGKEWIAKCPCHSDNAASLSINEGDNGNVVMICRAGCKTENILFKKGLKFSDLFASNQLTQIPVVPIVPKIVNVYDYVGADGKLIFQVCRYKPKDFRQRRPDPDNPGQFIWNMNGVQRVLYRLPRVIAAIKTGETIFITEGEKATEAAESIGLIATNALGGAGKWKNEYTPYLKGANCIILPDNDDPGRAHAKQIHDAIYDTAKSVRIVELPGLPKKGDIYDFIESRDAQDLESIRTEIINLTKKESFDILPQIIDAASFTSNPIPEPPQVIVGVLHKGSKAVYGGPSKAFKTWTLLDVGLAVATGNDWFGFQTTRGPVLYMNFELQPFAVYKRLKIISETCGYEIPHNFHIWNLRGFSRPLSQLLPELLRQIKGEGYSLIIPDPIYKTLAGKNENDAGDIGTVCGEIESLAVLTGAAVAFGAHFAKGNASSKDHIDRVSGSGVWARDPDSIITATTHEMEGCFSVEMTLRNFPPPPPFVIRWEFPRMKREDDLDPAALKQPNNGRSIEYRVSDILEHLTEPMSVSAWQKICKNEAGISEASFYRRFKEAKFNNDIRKNGKLWEISS